MKLSIDDVLYRINQTDNEQGRYKEFARQWEKMWCLDSGWDKDASKSVAEDGKEQITLPTPYNVVSLAERLISTDPDIEVPPRSVDQASDKERDKKQRWLKALWQRASHQGRRDIISDAWWISLVRGRGVFEVKWVDNVLPKRMQKNRIPILIRTLDPLNCGFKNGPLYTEYAYHRWDEKPEILKQTHPKLNIDIDEMKFRRKRAGTSTEVETVEVIDFWYVDPKDGSIWNCVVVDNSMAKDPHKTDYYDIPLVQFRGENYPVGKDEYDGLSILHPIKDLWPYQNRLVSQMGTGVLWHFWPHIMVQNEYGEEIPDLQVKPGVTQPYPWGTKIDVLQSAPNVPMAERLLSLINGSSQQSTFPEVMYGEAPGDLQAGYGVSLLADAAKGRVAKSRRNLEMAMEVVNEIALCMVEVFGEDEGVKMWGYGEAEAGQFSVSLMPEDIGGYYENSVKISPRVPTDELQRTTLGIRLAQGGLISDQTLRNKFIADVLPADEQYRIAMEQAMKSEQLAPAVQRKALEHYFGPTWKDDIGLTELEAEMKQKQMEAQQQQMAAQQGGPPGGMQPRGMGGPQAGSDMPIQPESISQGVIPPAMEGQLERGPMGLPPDVPPELLAEALGKPQPTDDEVINKLMGNVNNGR